MSNYLALVLSHRGRDNAAAWLQRTDDSETRKIELADGALLVLRSRDIAERLGEDEFFIGNAIDHDRREIAFGLSGWRAMGARGEPDAVLAGEFLGLSWTPDGVRLRRDFSASIALLETRAEEWVAFSDSLLVLAELRRDLGAPVTANLRAALARTRTLAIAVQPLSRGTALREISFVPANETRELHLGGGSLGVRRVAVPVKNDPGATVADSVARMRRLAADTVAVVRALAGESSLVPALALSGGVDSRLLLGAARQSDVVERLFLESWQRTSSNREDFLVASMLREILALPDSNRDTELGEDIDYGASVLSIWASSGMGLYDRILPARSAHERPRRAVMSGVGAELVKGNYGRRTLAQLDAFYHVDHPDPSAYAAERRDALMAEWRAGLRALGADPNNPDSSEQHYWGYRVGLHGAAHSCLFLSGVRPLQHPLALELARGARGWGRPRDRASLDMLCLVDPELARIPFADGRSQRDGAQISAIQQHYGGELREDEIPEYRILGDISETWTGPSEYGLRAARRAGWEIEHDPEEIMRRVRETVDHVDDEPLRSVLSEQLPLIENGLVRDHLELRDVSPALATHLSFDLFRFLS